MDKNTFRLLAIVLLDDEDGINAEAAERLELGLQEFGIEDVPPLIKYDNDRAFIGEDDADTLRNVGVVNTEIVA